MKASITILLAAVSVTVALPLNPQEAHQEARRSDAPYGDKKGLAYSDGSLTTVLSTSGSATWAYNWGTAQDAPLFQQIPMMWGPGSEGDAAGCLAAVKAGSPWVLGYNEPDKVSTYGGCDKTPQEVYDAWGDDMFQFTAAGAKLVCPAITSDNTEDGATGGPSGLTWLKEFLAIGDDPSQFQCSAQALHWYGTEGDSASDQAYAFTGYIESAYSQVTDFFGEDMLIWVTEFSPMPTDDMQLMADFLAIAIPWLDDQDYVDRYSPYMADYFVTDGALNVGGIAFVDDS